MEERESVKVLLEAAELQRRKSADYQNPNSTVVQADYYPNGVKTIQDIIWAKVLRARSLLEAEEGPKNESLEDTYLDMINYCSFAVAWLRGKVPGQGANRDAFNRPLPVPVPEVWTEPRVLTMEAELPTWTQPGIFEVPELTQPRWLPSDWLLSGGGTGFTVKPNYTAAYTAAASARFENDATNYYVRNREEK